MTLLEATATLIDCAKTFGPELDRTLAKAVRRMEKRLRLLQLRKAKALRKHRHYAWKTLQHLQRACRCGYDFGYGEFVRTAELNHRGWIVRFDCPACTAPIVALNHDHGCDDYWVQCLNEKGVK